MTMMRGRETTTMTRGGEMGRWWWWQWHWGDDNDNDNDNDTGETTTTMTLGRQWWWWHRGGGKTRDEGAPQTPHHPPPASQATAHGVDGRWNAEEGETREEGHNKCIMTSCTANYHCEQLLMGWKWGATGGDNTNGKDGGSKEGGGAFLSMDLYIIYCS